jgi:oligopeptide/dipeptide ABC transporter ATP-binding protein
LSSLLEVKNLKTYFKTDRGLVKAVDGVSFYIDEHEIVGLVGESGCGKSVSMLSTIQLIPTPPGIIADGKVLFDGVDLLQYKAKGEKMSAIRGGKIAMIFQEPMTSLNPVLTIGRQITEMLELHLHMNPHIARERAAELLNLVGIPDAKSRLDDYPHQFSGGMRQRVMIAIVLSCNPKIIIADEPTTALDVTTQAQLARYAQRIYVMYAGRIVESGLSNDIFLNPLHPYTIGLLKCVPQLGETKSDRQLVPISGLPPNLIDMPQNCAFLPRCSHHVEKCQLEVWPELHAVGKDHFVSCYVDTRENQ